MFMYVYMCVCVCIYTYSFSEQREYKENLLNSILQSMILKLNLTKLDTEDQTIEYFVF